MVGELFLVLRVFVSFDEGLGEKEQKRDGNLSPLHQSEGRGACHQVR